MLEFLALLETEVGKAIIAKFAQVGGISSEAMKARVKSQPSLAAYFVEVANKVVAELKAEAAA